MIYKEDEELRNYRKHTKLDKGILSERIQCVRVENVFSSWKSVKSGVP